jgi:glycosyltransferase involved in cell wall biosynthesis
VAARLALGPRPILLHTYHGHVLSGYFGPAKTAAWRAIERTLAATTDRLVGVSQATVDELVDMGIAPPERFVTIPVGLELDEFLTSERADGAAFRDEVGAGPDDVLALFAGRLAPIKRVDLLLEAVAAARRDGARLRLAVVGDGELRPALEARCQALGLVDAVAFCGFRADIAAIASGADLAVLSSDNEGTPVALIEAAAAARPAVSTRVGGVHDVVLPQTGILVPAGDAAALGRALATIAADRDLRRRMGAAARAHVEHRFSADRLIRDIDELYGELLARRRGPRS